MAGDDYEWGSTWPLRLLRTGLLLFVIVLASTYTANLASFVRQQWLNRPSDGHSQREPSRFAPVTVHETIVYSLRAEERG